MGDGCAGAGASAGQGSVQHQTGVLEVITAVKFYIFDGRSHGAFFGNVSQGVVPGKFFFCHFQQFLSPCFQLPYKGFNLPQGFLRVAEISYIMVKEVQQLVCSLIEGFRRFCKGLQRGRRNFLERTG